MTTAPKTTKTPSLSTEIPTVTDLAALAELREGVRQRAHALAAERRAAEDSGDYKRIVACEGERIALRVDARRLVRAGVESLLTRWSADLAEARRALAEMCPEIERFNADLGRLRGAVGAIEIEQQGCTMNPGRWNEIEAARADAAERRARADAAHVVALAELREYQRANRAIPERAEALEHRIGVIIAGASRLSGHDGRERAEGAMGGGGRAEVAERLALAFQAEIDRITGGR